MMPDQARPQQPDYVAIVAYLRASFADRNTKQVGPFLASFTPHDDNPYLNYAIPDDGAEPTDQDVQALIAAYAARNRKPRLEYLSELAPKVEDPLLRGGFSV